MSTVSPGPAGGGAGTGLAEPLPPALELDHVSASYGPYRALFDVTFDVPTAGIAALIGSNGAGKSTVARVVTGLLASTLGVIRLGGRDVTGLPAYKIARAGSAHVPEGRGVFASLTVEENLRLAFRQRGGRKSVAGSLERAFESFPVLSARRRQFAGTLSGGEQRILSLAKVLVEPPRLLVADEISLGLAPVMIDAVYEGLIKINQAGTALLIVEQQVDRVLDIAATAIVLEHGAVAYSGPAEDALAAVESVMAKRGDQVVPRTGPRPDGASPGWNTGQVDQELRFRRRSRNGRDARRSPRAATAAPTPSDTLSSDTPSPPTSSPQARETQPPETPTPAAGPPVTEREEPK
jgi:branched-chain amino acid transport system ATP-binding protein